MFSCSTRPGDALYDVTTFPLLPGLPRRLYSFAQALALARVDFRAYDVVHTHGDNYLLARWGAQVRTFYGSAKSEARVAPRAALRAYYSLIAPLESLGARLSAYNVGISQATSDEIGRVDEIVPCGIDLDTFRPGEKSERPSVLFVGGLYGRKRGALLVEQFNSVVRPALPSAELWLVSAQRGEGDGIVNYGNVPESELAALYRRAWVFCMPSSYEGFGVPYVEAMASGTPVVTTPNPGASEVLDNGRYGELVSDETLGRAILAVLQQTGRRTELAQLGLLRAQRYAWDAVAGAYERIYAAVRETNPSLVRRVSRPVARS